MEPGTESPTRLWLWFWLDSTRLGTGTRLWHWPWNWNPLDSHRLKKNDAVAEAQRPMLSLSLRSCRRCKGRRESVCNLWCHGRPTVHWQAEEGRRAVISDFWAIKSKPKRSPNPNESLWCAYYDIWGQWTGYSSNLPLPVALPVAFPVPEPA